MKMKFAQITLVAATLLSTPALVMAQAPAANAVVVDAAVTDNIFQLYEGTVTKIDKKTRTIFFKNNDGESKFIAGPEIKSFDQIKVGDRLNVTYELAVAIELIKTKSDGIRSKVETASEVTSKPGEKPTRTITNTTTIIADIIAVDRPKKLVSVKGPSGKVTVVTVKNPQLLADVNVGEQVRVIYFDAMAASITPPKKK
jgi:antitoxin (DNA-binding transcriptional repressor) of toxin-antitoxin stability system